MKNKIMQAQLILKHNVHARKYLNVHDSSIVVEAIRSDIITKKEKDELMVQLCLLYKPIIRNAIRKQGVDEVGDRESLLSLGNIGIYDAVEVYDIDSGYRLSTVISTHVNKIIKRDAQNSKKFIRVPVHIIEKEKRIYTSLLELHNWKKMSREDILEYINKKDYKQVVTIGQLNDFLDKNYNYTMLESTISAKDNSSIPLSDRVSNGERTIEDVYEVKESLKAVENYLRTISPRDALVFVLFHGNFWKVCEEDIEDLRAYGLDIEKRNHNYEEISKILDISAYKVKTTCIKVTENIRKNIKV